MSGSLTIGNQPVEAIIRVHDRLNGDLLGDTTSNALGEFSVDILREKDVYIICLNPNQVNDMFNDSVYGRVIS